jgi:hypothetical protein
MKSQKPILITLQLQLMCPSTKNNIIFLETVEIFKILYYFFVPEGKKKIEYSRIFTFSKFNFQN